MVETQKPSTDESAPDAGAAEKPEAKATGGKSAGAKGVSADAIAKATVLNGNGKSVVVIHLPDTGARAEVFPHLVEKHLAKGFRLGEPPAK